MFKRLPLGEKLIRARETHLLARSEQFDPLVARSLKRIALQEALRLSPEERESQGFVLKVIGHHNEEGKVFVPDEQFSDYKIYLTFPQEDDIAYLRDFRRGLAGNPLEEPFHCYLNFVSLIKPS